MSVYFLDEVLYGTPGRGRRNKICSPRTDRYRVDHYLKIILGVCIALRRSSFECYVVCMFKLDFV
jgi:hypothetical protein